MSDIRPFGDVETDNRDDFHQEHDWTGFVAKDTLSEIRGDRGVTPAGFAPPKGPTPANIEQPKPKKTKLWKRGGGSGGSGPTGGSGGLPPVPRELKRSRPAKTIHMAMMVLHLIALGLGLAGMMTGYDPFYVAGVLGLSALVGLTSLFMARQANIFLRHGLSITAAVASLLWGMIALPMTGFMPNGLGPIFATIVFCLVGAVGRSLVMVLLGFSMLVMWAVATNAAGLPAKTSILSLMIGIFVVAVGAMTIRSSLISLSVLLFSALAASAILWSTGFEPYAIAGMIGVSLTAIYHGYGAVKSPYTLQMRDMTGLLLISTLFVFQALTEAGVNLERGWALRNLDQMVIQTLIILQVATLIFNLYRWRLRRMTFPAVILMQMMMGAAFMALLFPNWLLPPDGISGLIGAQAIASSTLIIAMTAAAGFALSTTMFIRAWRADEPLLTGLVALLFISQGVILGRWLSPYPQELVIAAGLSTMAIILAILMSHRNNRDGSKPIIRKKVKKPEGYSRGDRLSFGVNKDGPKTV